MPDQTKSPAKGMVYLVGAGPGRADLITLRGVELIKRADCVICDKLVNPALLRHARSDAEIINVPKRIGDGSFLQHEINDLLIKKASAGMTIVRLKGGDPCIFGRGAEEARLLAAAGVPYEIVPGVTAAIAAAEYTGIMLTDRDHSSQVAFITGREAEGKEDSSVDWDLLGPFRGTIVFYMGIGTLEHIVTQLLQNGMNPDTPAALVANATMPSQRVVRSRAADLSRTRRAENIEPPALVIIGPAAAGEFDIDWFMKRPLFGRRIVITRDPLGNVEFADKIIERGAEPIDFPTFVIRPLTQTSRFVQALAKMPEYDWIVFTSANGIGMFFEALEDLGKDARVFGHAKIATLGKKTADKLAQFALKSDFTPTIFTGKDLANQLVAQTSVKGKKMLLLRSELASQELGELLTEAGAEVDDVPTYTAVPHVDDSADLIEQISDKRIDWLTFASPSAVNNFFEQIPLATVTESQVKIASIGPVTTDCLAALGASVTVSAKVHTLDGTLDAIEQFEQSGA